MQEVVDQETSVGIINVMSRLWMASNMYLPELTGAYIKISGSFELFIEHR